MTDESEFNRDSYYPRRYVSRMGEIQDEWPDHFQLNLQNEGFINLLPDGWPPLVKTASDWLVLADWHEENGGKGKAATCRNVALHLERLEIENP